MLVALTVVKHERGAIAGRELRERAVERHSINQLRRAVPARAEGFGWSRLDAFERVLPSRLALAKAHQNLIDRQTVEPGVELALAAEAARLPVKKYEYLLRDVLGFRDVLRHA